MAYLTTFYWGWLLASLLLGFAMGWISVVQHGEGVSKKLRWWLAALAAALVAAAVARVVPGRFGYWLDLGLIMFALYLCGCAVGSWLRDWVVSRSAPHGMIASMARSAHHHRHQDVLAGPCPMPRNRFQAAGLQQNCAPTVINSA